MLTAGCFVLLRTLQQRSLGVQPIPHADEDAEEVRTTASLHSVLLPDSFGQLESSCQRHLSGDESGFAEEAEAGPAPESCLRSQADLVRRSAALTSDLRTGNVGLGEVIDLASSFVDEVDPESSKILDDGSTEYEISVPEELGVAKLQVHPCRNDDVPQYAIVLQSDHAQHDVLGDEFTLGNRLEIRLGFEDGRANHCSAFTYAKPLPSPGLYESFGDQGWIPVGGSISTDDDSSEWTAVQMRLTERDGVPVMRQETTAPEMRFERLDDYRSLALLGTRLRSLHE